MIWPKTLPGYCPKYFKKILILDIGQNILRSVCENIAQNTAQDIAPCAAIWALCHNSVAGKTTPQGVCNYHNTHIILKQIGVQLS